VIPFDNTFLGPAALTKAYRFAFDPRDGARARRLRAVGEPRGMWDCVHCYEADEHCPRGIDPTQRIIDLREMAVGLGPAKGKDFATSLGPLLVTPDELGDLRLEMVARVNGEERSRGSLGDIHWPWEELAAHAARNTRLAPGDVLGSGTVGTGCILEHGDGRWLRPGDVVELEIDGIGVLRNVIGGARDSGTES